MGNKRRPTRSTSEATPARKAAFELLRSVREQETFLSRIAPRVLGSYSLDASDAAFARLLAQGALSLQVTLDTLIDRVLRSPRDIKVDVRDALRLSAYEILYLHKEDHAAVDQGVELVRWFAPRATGVANYVLHRIVEERDRFPYGNPSESLEAAALLAGFPLWLARAIKKDIGLRNAFTLMEESLAPAPVYFMANAGALSRKELVSILETAGIEFNTCRCFMPGAQEDLDAIFQLAHRSDVGNEAFLELLKLDKIVVSDLSAQSIVLRGACTLLKDGARMLEIGAGRGTKTLQFQSICKEAEINLVAYDVIDSDSKKLHQLESRVVQTGGKTTEVVASDATKPLPFPENAYDLVFIDAPCTGVGTLRRHPEIKARLEETDSRTLAKTGQAMLFQAAHQVRVRGYLMYATCTIFKEENEKTIKRFLASPAGQGFEIVPIGAKGAPFFKTPVLKGGPDLHFAALLQRVAE